MIAILLVDDHPSVMEGTKAMLEKDPSFEVTICSDPVQAAAITAEQSFDVMLFDMHMPGMTGLELAKHVLKREPEAIIVIYTGVDIPPMFNKLIEAGVSGIISKTASQEQLVTAIRCAARKEAVVPVALLRELRRDMAVRDADLEDEGVSLSDKDVTLLQGLAKGKSNRIMADELIMSQRSLEYALTRLFQKLKVHSRIEAVSKAKQAGILTDMDFM